MATLLDTINQMNALQTEYNRMNAIQKQYDQMNAIINYCDGLKSACNNLYTSSTLSEIAKSLKQSTLRDAMKSTLEQYDSFKKQFELLYDTPIHRAFEESQRIANQIIQSQREVIEGMLQYRDRMNSLLQGIGVPYNAILELKKLNANYLFSFEGNYENQYQQLYKNIPDTSRIVIEEDAYTNRDELFVQEEDGSKYPLSYTKDIAGAKIIFPDISENEIYSTKGS